MEPAVGSEAPLLPAGTRLIHIGPSKTGTTSVQASMWAAREAMHRQGVRYAGRIRHSEGAARAISGVKSPLSDVGARAPMRLWEQLVEDIREAEEPRLVFSSELLAHSHTDAIMRIAGELDPSRFQVAVTLRPLTRILASQWQQNVQAGQTEPYDSWLRSLFDRPAGSPESAWWHRHRHDRLVARWAAVAGADRVTVIVVDDRDHAQVLRVFKSLLGLQAGTLELQQDLANRSLTLAEVEAVRAFNAAWDADGLGRELHTRLVRLGLAVHMKSRRPDADEPRVETPQWALDRAGEIEREVVHNLAASGVRIVGDLSSLTEVPVSRLAGDQLPDPAIPPSVAASMSIGLLVAGGLARVEGAADGKAVEGAPRPGAIARVPTRRIASTIYRRSRGSIRGRYLAARRRLRAAVNRGSTGR